MEARRFCFLYNFCHHAGQRARRIPVYLHRRRRRPVRVHPLFRFQHSRKNTARSPAVAALHGVPRWPAVQREPPAPVPHAGKPGAAARDDCEDRRFSFYKRPKTLHRPKGSFTNPQGIYLVEKRTLQNAKSFFLLLRDGKDTIRK